MSPDISQSVAAKVANAGSPKRGWFRRNWLWFVPVLIVAIVVIGAGAAYWQLFYRVYRLEVVQEATKTIKADKQLQEKLGTPIHKVWWPSREAIPNARIEEEEKDVLWHIHGPKGEAKVHVLAKLRMGQWQTVTFDVILPNGKKIALEAQGEGSEAPPAPFQPPKAGDKSAEKKPEKTGPPPDVDLKIPE